MPAGFQSVGHLLIHISVQHPAPSKRKSAIRTLTQFCHPFSVNVRPNMFGSISAYFSLLAKSFRLQSCPGPHWNSVLLCWTLPKVIQIPIIVAITSKFLCVSHHKLIVYLDTKHYHKPLTCPILLTPTEPCPELSPLPILADHPISPRPERYIG